MKRVLIFWMWNDELHEETIRRQIHEFKSQGVEGFFIHPMPSEFRSGDFPGGMPGYLSGYYFEMIRVAVKCAAELDMEAWLYDEGGWPSGTLNGYFRDHRPDLMAQTVFADGRIEYNGFTPDLFNPEVTRIFIDSVHEKYRECVGEYFGTTIPGIFTDEPSFGFVGEESLPYSPVMEDVFLREKGYELKNAVKMILNDKNEKAILDYHEIKLKLMRESYLLPIQQWCHANHLLFTGHFNGDESVKKAVQLLGGDLAALHECLDIPGCDAIWRQIHPLVPESDFTRMTVSAAGNKPVISETFAVYGSDLSLAEMKQIASMQFVAGIKLIAPMAFHYSDRGGRQVTTVSNLFGADCRWQNYRAFADFSRRMSKVSDRCVPVIKTLVPFPTDQLRTGKADPLTVYPAGLALAEKQITYNYSKEAEHIAEQIEPDVTLLSPEPLLRTRHLKSPRGERRIFVNAGLKSISVKFYAPAGYNAWYDPADGKHAAAVADKDGVLSLELPFAGTMVLLTIPGTAAENRITPVFANYLPLNFRFTRIVRQLKAAESGLMETIPDKTAGKYFSGVIRFEAETDLPRNVTGKIVLPHALRAMCAVEINGSMKKINWPPYNWNISLPKGKNILVLEISTVPDGALHEPEYRKYLEDNKFINVYMGYCDKFEKLFPGEKPLEGAYLQW